MSNMNVISISLYGDNPIYSKPLLKNLSIRKEFFPDWEIYVFVDDSQNKETLKALEESGARVFLSGENKGSSGMLWRYKPIFFDDVENLLFAEADSYFTTRYQVAVNNWLHSDKLFFTARDHPMEANPIMGGLWGSKKKGIDLLKPIMSKEAFISDQIYHPYGYDEKILAIQVYKPLRKHFLIFSEFTKFRGEKPIPIPVARKNNSDYLGRKDEDINVYIIDNILEKFLKEVKIHPQKYPKTIPYPHTISNYLYTRFIWSASATKKWILNKFCR